MMMISLRRSLLLPGSPCGWAAKPPLLHFWIFSTHDQGHSAWVLNFKFNSRITYQYLIKTQITEITQIVCWIILLLAGSRVCVGVTTFLLRRTIAWRDQALLLAFCQSANSSAFWSNKSPLEKKTIWPFNLWSIKWNQRLGMSTCYHVIYAPSSFMLCSLLSLNIVALSGDPPQMYTVGTLLPNTKFIIPNTKYIISNHTILFTDKIKLVWVSS